jgi:short subunit dehydrogenase-like uncharacterized protein
MILPAVGFDVVPTDCLAAHVARRLPSANRLALAFVFSRPSRGTMLTMVEHLNSGGMVRRERALVTVPPAWKIRMIDFGRGPIAAVSIPWGDVATALYTTGIPNVEVYAAIPAGIRRLMVLSRFLRPLFRSRMGLSLIGGLIRRLAAGPSDAQRARGRSLFWAEAEDPTGKRVLSRMSGPEGYRLTAMTAVGIVHRVLDGPSPPGFQTPARAYGADFVLGIDGVTREDVI